MTISLFVSATIAVVGVMASAVVLFRKRRMQQTAESQMNLYDRERP